MTSKQAVLELIELLKRYQHKIVNEDTEIITIKGYPVDRIIKDLEDFEWLKNKIGLKVLDSLPIHDKFELLRILGINMSEWEDL